MLAGQVIVQGVPPTIVTVKLQELVLPAVSIALQTTIVVPTPKLEPEGGLQTGVPKQLPVVVGGGYVTVAQGVVLGGGSSLVQVAFAAWVILAGQVIAQPERLLTLTAKLQVATTTFDVSFPLQTTVLSPTGKLEPEGGLQVIVRLGQEPDAVAVV